MGGVREERRAGKEEMSVVVSRRDLTVVVGGLVNQGRQ